MPRDPEDLDDDLEDEEGDGDEGEGDEGDQPARLSVKDLKALRRRAKRAEKAEKEAHQLRRERAFEKAKIDVDKPAAELFVKHYEGDLDPAKIQEEAKRLGVPLTVEVPPEGPKTDEGEDKSTEERGSAASNAGGDDGKETKPDPYAKAKEAAEGKLKGGATEEAALASGFRVIAEAAESGDERVLVDEG